MVLLGDVAQVEAWFGLFGDSANLDASLVNGLPQTYLRRKIFLDAPDVTPRRLGSCQISFQSVWRRCYCWCKIGAQFAPNIP
jgi:hypothetical protein